MNVKGKKSRKDIIKWLNIIYYGMRARTQNTKLKVYGMPCLSKDEFYKWLEEDMDSFLELHNNWLDSNYDSRLTPTVDRVDVSKGYIPGNLQWLTIAENTKKAHRDYPDMQAKAYRARWGKDKTPHIV